MALSLAFFTLLPLANLSSAPPLSWYSSPAKTHASELSRPRALPRSSSCNLTDSDAPIPPFSIVVVNSAGTAGAPGILAGIHRFVVAAGSFADVAVPGVTVPAS